MDLLFVEQKKLVIVAKTAEPTKGLNFVMFIT
jgi:hypothetical protein